MSEPLTTVDVYCTDTELEVRCMAGTKSNKLEIDRVTFHGLSDDQYRAIVRAIEVYLQRKKLRERAPSS